jgi:hypothetical protein
MVARLTLSQFSRFVGSGRNSPAICGCERQDGTPAGEFVVKFRGSETGTNGLMCELVASLLAGNLGINTPEPAVVELGADLADSIAALERSKASIMRKSAGLNFGSRLLSGGSVWPTDKPLVDAMRQQAAEVFAFDALIQNVDRRFDRPNLFVRGDEIIAFDHEAAFSFLYSLSGGTKPWLLASEKYLEEHVFYRPLRRSPVPLARFIAVLKSLDDGALAQIEEAMPGEWRSDNLPIIMQHLKDVRENADAFGEEIKRKLM